MHSNDEINDLTTKIEKLTERINELEVNQVIPKIQLAKFNSVVAFNVTKAIAFDLAVAAADIQVTRSQLLRDIIMSWIISHKKLSNHSRNRPNNQQATVNLPTTIEF
ncbi:MULTISPECIES: hypothetical protein [unclassified Microcoleus]|uniref:hypothetical protein n=1 Tax=unclassified Microcoleus TaxID=2642155 RepID=UPI002FCFAB51